MVVKAILRAVRTPDNRRYVLFNGAKYALRNTGYLGKTTDGHKDLLHRDVWKATRGPIPRNYEVHHKNGNRLDCRPSNLLLIRIDEHARRFPNRQNQYTVRQRKRRY